MGDACSIPIPAPPELLFAELRTPMARYLRCLGLAPAEAEDAVQEAFLKLHRHVAAGGSQENVRSWLFRVAHNEARNRSARYESRKSAPLELAAPLAAAGADPERQMLDRERYRRLDAAMKALSGTERECVLLRGEGLRYREIGEVLGIATSTVADTVDRAIRKLAEKCNV